MTYASLNCQKAISTFVAYVEDGYLELEDPFITPALSVTAARIRELNSQVQTPRASEQGPAN